MKNSFLIILTFQTLSYHFCFSQNWDYVNIGIPNSDSSFIFSSLKTDGKFLLGLGRITGWTYYIPGGLMLSEDAGSTWQYKSLINPQFGNESLPISTLLKVDTILFAGSPGGGIYKTTSWGDEWINANNGITGNAYGIRTLELLNGNIYAGTENGVYISTNFGESWEERNTGIPTTNVGYNTVTSIIEIEDTLYAGVFDSNQGEGGIFKSTNYGDNWTPFITQIYLWGNYYNCDVLTMKYFNNMFFIATQGLGIFKSSNFGYSWEHTETYGDYVKIATENSYMIAISGTLELSKDIGNSWMDIRYNLQNMNYGWFNTAEIIDNYVFVGSERIGLWKFNLDQINSASNETNLSRGFNLTQNYPNPFNPSTTIRYEIPEQSFVTIKIYDILGNEIITLVNEEKRAGNYVVKFSAESLPSGIYFYKLQAGSYIQTKKMVFQK